MATIQRSRFLQREPFPYSAQGRPQSPFVVQRSGLAKLPVFAPFVAIGAAPIGSSEVRVRRKAINAESLNPAARRHSNP
jgi:hypothetical protein